MNITIIIQDALRDQTFYDHIYYHLCFDGDRFRCIGTGDKHPPEHAFFSAPADRWSTGFADDEWENIFRKANAAMIQKEVVNVSR